MHQPGIYFCNTKDMEQHRYTSENMNPAVLGFDENFFGIQEEERRNYVVQGVDCPAAKDAYLTYDDARRALRQRSVQQQKDKRIYKCDICGYWHFTTKPGSHRYRCKGYNRSRGREEMQRMCSLLVLDSLKGRTEKGIPQKALRISYNLLSDPWTDRMSA